MTNSHRRQQEMRATSNPTVYWKVRRGIVLHCGICRPHHLENWGRKPRTNRYKDIRRGRGMAIRTFRDPHVWRLFA
jgi:hypothetical protein